MQKDHTQKQGRGANQKGFTLLLAALVASIVLTLGASIFSIAQKQVTLSSLGRDSQFAFYAADTIAECALYYDVRYIDWFATSTDPHVMLPVECDEETTMPLLGSATANSAESTFSMTVFKRNETGAPNPLGGNCAEVTIRKNSAAPHTTLIANGYSTPCGTIASSPRSLQRTIRIEY